MSKLIVHAKILIDGVSDTPKKDQLISIEDGKIVSIKEYHETNEEAIHANVVTPGFFNCHVHIMEPVGFGTDKKFSLMEKAFYTQKHCEDYLHSGVTFIRVLGTANDYDMQIRDCIDSGLIQDGIEADGKDECRKAARTLLKEGVDIIKIMATGGVMTKGVEPGSAQLTQEEMAVIIEEAHKAGRKTATHAQGTQGIKNALYAGIDSIEHGIFLDQECLDFMKERGTYLVPTLVAPQCIVENGIEAGIADYMVKKAIYVKDAHVKSFKAAYAQGLKIALGTDGGTPFNYHNNTAYEMELMEKYGVDRMDILKIATHNSADCLGVLDEYGTLEVGKHADLVCLEENPLDDISNVRKIVKVIKDGVVVQ